jgi:hypothetical protein
MKDTGMAGVRRNQGGSTLVLTLLMIMTVTILLFANATIVQTYLKLSTEAMNGAVAENAARAGLARSIYELRKSPGWDDGFARTRLGRVPEASFVVTFDALQNSLPYSTSAYGSGSAKKGYGGRTVPPGYAHIVSVGNYLKQQKISEAMVRLGGFYPFANAALFADVQGMNLPNLGASDSWNSTDGTYARTHINADGTIGSNTTGHHGVTLGNGARIFGIIDIGPGGIPGDVVQARPSQYEGIANLPSPISMPDITIPDLGTSHGNVTVPQRASVTLPPGEYGDLTLNAGSVLTLEDGSYSFGNITANYNAHQRPRRDAPLIEASPANDPVVIYVSGNVNLANADLVNSHKNDKGAPVPSYLQIYCASTTRTVELRCGTSRGTGGAGTYCVLYAPNSILYLNGNRQNSALYGAIVAGEIRGARRGNTDSYATHYDKALQGFRAPDGLVPGADSSLKVEATW